MRKIDKPFSAASLKDVFERRLGIPLTTSFIVAYSGGRDSHALLHALCSLRDTHDVSLRAVHVDHGLQPASRAWSEHCVRICANLQVPIAVERIEVRPEGEESIEAAARRLRYERLAVHLRPAEVLLTAHHQDDQAETVLLALLRGAGMHGLAAMPESAEFGVGRRARPLLGFSRSAIAAYVQAQGLSWMEDTSNRDERWSRNFLRAQVLPLLESRWPAAARVLARAAANSAKTATLLDEIAHADMALCRGNNDDASLSLAALRHLSSARQRNLVRYWIRRNGFQAPSARHLDRILDQADRPSRSGHACVDWPDVQVHRYRDRLTIRPRRPESDRGLVLPWQPPQALEIPDIGWRLSAVAEPGAGLSQARVAHVALTLRLRQGGEICQLAGRAHHHKLKKLLQGAGVPPWERERLPLIYADGELAAVGDRWVCAPFAAQPNEPGWRIVLESSN